MTACLEVGLLLGAPERRALPRADLLEGVLLLLDALESGAVDVLDLPARPPPVLHGARVLLVALAVLNAEKLSNISPMHCTFIRGTS